MTADAHLHIAENDSCINLATNECLLQSTHQGIIRPSTSFLSGKKVAFIHNLSSLKGQNPGGKPKMSSMDTCLINYQKYS